MDDMCGQEELVTVGISLGTVIGPILFIIYFNYFLQLDSIGVILSFADDTAIIYELQNWSEIQQIANATKTKIIPFTSYKPFLPDSNTISVGNRTLELVHTVKYYRHTY